MKSFLLMLSFFTRLPVPHVEYEEARYKNGIKYVPIIGLLVGFILFGLSKLIHYLKYDLGYGMQIGNFDLIAMATLFIVYIVTTGAIHLDGVADTCDGILSGRERAKMLEIMKDSHIGVFGVVGLMVWGASFFVLLETINQLTLILLPVVGKSAMILSAYMAPYARKDGFGRFFSEGCRGKHGQLIWTLIVLILVSFISPMIGGIGLNLQAALTYMLCIATALSAVIVMTAYFKKKLGGITGDTLGFTCEVSQIVFGVSTLFLHWIG